MVVRVGFVYLAAAKMTGIYTFSKYYPEV